MQNHLLFAALAGLLVACGATEAIPEPVIAPAAVAPSPAAPPAVEPPVDHGAVSTTYPAFAPSMGQLANNGGAVLKNPTIVTVTWAGDTKAIDLEALGDTIGAGPYWKDTTSEYGTSGAVSGEANHIRLTDAAPASMSDQELAAFVAASVTSGTFPTPATGEPLYILYLPMATKLLLQGKSACAQGVGGYHDSTTVGSKSIAFAIVPRCDSSLESVTVSASHELVEAATDPYPRSTPAWAGFVGEHLAWEFFQQFQSENADSCEFYRDSHLSAGVESGLGFTVQRSWSNKSAAAGHDPCVPAFSSATFFNTTPLDLEDIDIDLSSVGGNAGTTKGFKVAVGATRTIPIGFYSDGPVGAWTIEAVAGGIADRRTKTGVDLSLDVTSGQNGEKAYLTATVTAAGETGTELVTIVSRRGGTSHYMPILIGSQ